MDLRILKGKRALITGATGGIGKKIANELAAYGCDLFITGRDKETLEQLTEDLSSFNIDVFNEPIDLTRDEEIDRLVSKVKGLMGNIDILINCAGVFPIKGFLQTDRAGFDSCYAVNVRAPFYLSRAFAKDMIDNRWGRIVNLGSSSSYAGFRETSVYCSSKHALLGLSRSLSDELKEYNVRVFCFSPGSVKTEMGRKVKNQDFETFINPSEVAKYITFCISFDDEMIADEVRLNRINMQ